MKPLDSLAKRDLLAAEKFAPETILGYADEFLAHGHHGDAFAFFRKLNDENGIRRVMEAAIADAETDVLWLVERYYPEMMTREQWARCGENAMCQEKFRCAAYVFERIGDTARLSEAEKTFKPAEAANPDTQSPPQA